MLAAPAAGYLIPSFNFELNFGLNRGDLFQGS